jgi:hypothetical protein
VRTSLEDCSKSLVQARQRGGLCQISQKGGRSGQPGKPKAQTIVLGHVHVEINSALKNGKHRLQGVFAVAFCVELVVKVQRPQEVAGDGRRRSDALAGIWM